MIRYRLMTAAARMPANCWGRYARIGVVELEEGYEGYPSMISARARGVARVVETWERLYVGKTDRCAFEVAMREAEELLASLEELVS